MHQWKLKVLSTFAILVVACCASSASAQVVVIGGGFGPRFGPPIVAPAIVAPRVVARAVVPSPVVAYRSSFVAPAAFAVPAYSAYRPVVVAQRPVYAAPVYAAPVVVTASVRPAYVPFQPVRNAIRLSRPF